MPKKGERKKWTVQCKGTVVLKDDGSVIFDRYNGIPNTYFNLTFKGTEEQAGKYLKEFPFKDREIKVIGIKEYKNEYSESNKK